MSKFFSLWNKEERIREDYADGSYTVPKSVVLSEDLFTHYKSSRTSWEKQSQQDEEFRKGAQWSSEEIAALEAANQAPVVINIIAPSVDQAKAMLTANNPRFSSTGRDDSDTKTGKVFADLLAYVWEKSEGNLKLKQSIDDYYVKGMGAMFVYLDPYADFGKGEIKISSIDPYHLYIDPNSTDPYARDAAHLIVSKIFTREQIEDIYPDAESKGIFKYAVRTEETNQLSPLMGSMEGQTDVFSDMYHTRYRVIDRYSKVKEIHYNIWDTTQNKEEILDQDEFKQYIKEPAIITHQGKKVVYITEDSEVQQFIELAIAGEGRFHFMPPELDENGQPVGEPAIMPGPEMEGSIPGSEGVIEITDNGFLLSKEVLIKRDIVRTRVQRTLSIGSVLYSQEILPISNYPIVTFMNNHNRTPYPQSDVRKVRGIQQEINKIESLLIAHASSSTSPKWWIPMGSVNKSHIEKELNKAGAAYLEYDPEIGIPIQASPVPLPNELYKNKADKIGEIERILGIYPLMQGDQSNAPQTYKGTITLDEFGQRRIRSKRVDIEGAINALASVVVEYIQKTYTEDKVFRLVQPNNLPTKEFSINQPLYDDFGNIIGKINDVTVGKYDVILVSGSMLPSNRFALAEYYKELLQIGAIDQQEFLVKTEVADVEGVLERIGQINQLQRLAQGLQEEIKSLKGDMQTRDREISHLMKKVEVEKFKSGLSEPKEAAKKSSLLYENLLNNEFKHQKQLMEMERRNNGSRQ